MLTQLGWKYRAEVELFNGQLFKYMANRNSIVLVNDIVVRGMPIYIHDMVKKNFGRRVPLRKFYTKQNK